MINGVKSMISTYKLFKGKPQSLGQGLSRVKKAMGATGEDLAKIPGERLYKGANNDKISIETGALYRDCDFYDWLGNPLNPHNTNEYCGTVLRIKTTNTHKNPNVKKGTILAMFRTWFQSDAITSKSGHVWNAPVKTVRTFGVYKQGSGKETFAWLESLKKGFNDYFTEKHLNPKTISKKTPKNPKFSYKVRDHRFDLRIAEMKLPEYGDKKTEFIHFGNTVAGHYDGYRP